MVSSLKNLTVKVFLDFLRGLLETNLLPFSTQEDACTSFFRSQIYCHYSSSIHILKWKTPRMQYKNLIVKTLEKAIFL